MKKIYLEPEAERIRLSFERNFLGSLDPDKVDVTWDWDNEDEE